jgi:hypothetical protein
MSKMNITDRICVGTGKQFAEQLVLKGKVTLTVNGKKVFHNQISDGLLSYLSLCMSSVVSRHIRPEELFDQDMQTGGTQLGKDGISVVIQQPGQDPVAYSSITTEITPVHGGRRWQGVLQYEEDSPSPSPSPSLSPSGSPSQSPSGSPSGSPSPSPSGSPSEEVTRITELRLGRNFGTGTFGFGTLFARRYSEEPLNPVSLPEAVSPGQLVTVEWELYFAPEAGSPSPSPS